MSCTPCRTCPNAPKTPQEWYDSLPHGTRLLLITVAAVSAIGQCLDTGSFYAQRGDYAPTHLDSAASSTIIATLFSPSLLLQTVLSSLSINGLLSLVFFLPRMFFDYGPIGLAFIFTVLFLMTAAGRVERDICGGYMLDIFPFPGKHLFTENTMPTTITEQRQCIGVRFLRFVWIYFVLGCMIAFGSLLLSLTTGTLLFWPPKYPSKGLPLALLTLWVWLQPPHTKLPLPFSLGALMQPTSASRGRAHGRPTSVDARALPYYLIIIQFIFAQGSLVVVIPDIIGAVSGAWIGTQLMPENRYEMPLVKMKNTDGTVCISTQPFLDKTITIPYLLLPIKYTLLLLERPLRVLLLRYGNTFTTSAHGVRIASSSGDGTEGIPFVPARHLEVPYQVYHYIRRQNAYVYEQKRAKGHLMPWGE